MSRLSPTGLARFDAQSASGQGSRNSFLARSDLSRSSRSGNPAAQDIYAQLLAHDAGGEGGGNSFLARSELSNLADRAFRVADRARRNEDVAIRNSRADVVRARTVSPQEQLKLDLLKKKWSAVQRAGSDPDNPLSVEQWAAITGQLAEEARVLNLPSPQHLYKVEAEEESPELKLANARDELETSLGDNWQPQYQSMVTVGKDGQLDYSAYHKERTIEMKERAEERRQQASIDTELMKVRQKAFDEKTKVMGQALLGQMVEPSGGGLFSGSGVTPKQALDTNLAKLKELHTLTQEEHRKDFPELYEQSEDAAPEAGPQLSPQDKALNMGLQFAPSPQDAVRMRKDGILRPGDDFVGWDGIVYSVTN